MKIHRMIFCTALLALCLNAGALDSLFPRKHPTLAMTMNFAGNETKIVIDRWQHWTSKKRPKSRIEKELRDEIKSYVFVTPEDRVKLEHTNSLLGYSGEGKFVLQNGLEIPWKQMSSILSVKIPGRNEKSDWQDFAPQPWVVQLEKQRGGPLPFP